MKILVINADCLSINSSANLCHLSYITGFLENGHEVTLISADGRDYQLDNSMTIPPQVEHHTFYGVSLYAKLSLRKNISSQNSISNSSTQNCTQPPTKGVKRKIKNFILALYGVHGLHSTFLRKAKRFKSNEHFDYVISISAPPASHVLAYKLLRKKRIIADKWIQIWEDPWYTDVYGNTNLSFLIHREEKSILKHAEKVCYVSPLTLKIQQKIFPTSAHKMYWQPLPCYYSNTKIINNISENTYGYFGDYSPVARNLQPFYEAAKELNIKVNICGNPSNLFESTDKIAIHPRLPLEELKPIENSTNVLVFLCNLKGGQIPGKIYQYSATPKTILFIVDGTPEEQRILTNYFKQFNRYVFCQNTIEDIKRAILDIEAGKCRDIKNEPIDYFEPKATIQRILNFEQPGM